MPRSNQIIVQEESDWYECIPCARTFNNHNSLLQHCQRSSSHKFEWCDRCEWLFVDGRARTDHCNNSQRHWMCQFCDRDEESRDELVEHEEDAHNYCGDCNIRFVDWNRHRIRRHHRCEECHQEFDSDNNLTMVRT